MILRKLDAVASNAAEAQRKAIEPSCQFFTRSIRCRTPPFVLSMTLVVAKQRISFGGRPIALIVNNSSRPSNKLADAFVLPRAHAIEKDRHHSRSQLAFGLQCLVGGNGNFAVHFVPQPRPADSQLAFAQ